MHRDVNILKPVAWWLFLSVFLQIFLYSIIIFFKLRFENHLIPMHKVHQRSAGWEVAHDIRKSLFVQLVGVIVTDRLYYFQTYLRRYLTGLCRKYLLPFERHEHFLNFYLLENVQQFGERMLEQYRPLVGDVSYRAKRYEFSNIRSHLSEVKAKSCKHYCSALTVAHIVYFLTSMRAYVAESSGQIQFSHMHIRKIPVLLY